LASGPQIQRGTGPDQLPYGLSSVLNQRLSQLPNQTPGPPPSGQAAPPSAGPGPQPVAGGSAAPATFRPGSPRDKAVYDTPGDPNAPPTQGVMRTGYVAPSDDYRALLPALQQAAQAPGAPPQIQDLLNLFVEPLG
jgi:hypothetical protein